jgi:hypothetical protein
LEDVCPADPALVDPPADDLLPPTPEPSVAGAVSALVSSVEQAAARAESVRKVKARAGRRRMTSVVAVDVPSRETSKSG